LAVELAVAEGGDASAREEGAGEGLAAALHCCDTAAAGGVASLGRVMHSGGSFVTVRDCGKKPRFVAVGALKRPLLDGLGA
jgi:hypothetical protein